LAIKDKRKILGTKKRTQLPRRHDGLSEAPNMLEDVDSVAQRAGRVVGMAENERCSCAMPDSPERSRSATESGAVKRIGELLPWNWKPQNIAAT
jgi:hypothetical protein